MNYTEQGGFYGTVSGKRGWGLSAGGGINFVNGGMSQ